MNLMKSQIFAIGIPVATLVMVYFIWKSTKPATNGNGSTTDNGAGAGAGAGDEGFRRA